MCGIYAFRGTSLDPDHLERAAIGAARRGPHGHGWAAITPAGAVHQHLLGPLTGRPAVPADAIALLGHGRLATVGDPNDPTGLQPLNAGPHWLAHNGNVYNPTAFAASHRTDSHALALAYQQAREAGMTPTTALKHLVTQAEQHAWVIAVLDGDGHLYGHRHAHPLYVCAGAGFTFWSSRPCCPTATPLPEDAPFTTDGDSDA